MSAYAPEGPSGARVQHEPKRERNKGAPDFKIVRNGITLGYVEGKEIGATSVGTCHPLSLQSGGTPTASATERDNRTWHQVNSTRRSRWRPSADELYVAFLFSTCYGNPVLMSMREWSVREGGRFLPRGCVRSRAAARDGSGSAN